MLQVGSPAPDFKLFNTEKQEIALSSFRGKNVVVLFYPLAFTGVCTTELCNMRDDIATYAGLNAEILAISVDSLFTLEKFKADQRLPFNLLSDFNAETSIAYDSVYENFVFGMKNVSKRAAFVVDAEGILRYVEVLDNAGNLPNFEAVKATLTSLS